MTNRLSRIGLLAILPLALFLGGCGWEPLIPRDPGPDGPKEQQPLPEHQPGVLAVAIKFDCQNCIATQSAQRNQFEAPIMGIFTADVSIPNPDVEHVIYYRWDFGDGTLDEGETVEHTFQNPGTYRVNLRVITSEGNETEDQIMVIAHPPTMLGPLVQNDSKEGELCSFERILPDLIVENEPFNVQVVITTKQFVQVIQWEDVSWFPGFRVKQEPLGLWMMVDAGHRISLEYEVELWQELAAKDIYMEGEVKCNAGGFGESEILTLRSQLNIELSDTN